MTHDELKALLSYNPDTGQLTWLVRTSTRNWPGKPAGCLAPTGYVIVGINRKLYHAHRLAFLYMTGEWPEEHVDHINGETADNRWVNLRPVSRSVNMQNRRAKANNAAGLLGVSRNGGRWSARIRDSSGRQHRLGTYSTPEEAHQVYLKAKREMHAGCTI